ncbi:MAG: hypothetical protein AB8G22_05950 [Saprospiraceae bacterium]
MRLFCLLLFLAFVTTSSAQKVLQLEKYGNLKKTRKYYIGQEVTYQLKGDDLWYTLPIERIIEEENIVVFNDRFVKLDSIRAIKSFHTRDRSRRMATTLNVFGIAWSVFALGGSIANEDFSYRRGDAITTATALTLGHLVKWIFKDKKYKMGRKYRLRTLDLSAKQLR